VAEGLELGIFKIPYATDAGDSTIYFLKINPNLWELSLHSAGQYPEKKNLSVKDWCRKLDLIAGINAGMYDTDYSKHIGLMVSSDYRNNPQANKSYLSVAGFETKSGNPPHFRIFDLDEITLDDIITEYHCVIQNLRLIKYPGKNRWNAQDKKWSEAALAEDSEGNALFIFCRSPYPMKVLNDALLQLPLKITRAQHLEGGPEAQFYFKFKETEINLIGSYETGFNESNLNIFAWPVPNIIGLKKR
jgi:hypothetical protein